MSAKPTHSDRTDSTTDLSAEFGAARALSRFEFGVLDADESAAPFLAPQKARDDADDTVAALTWAVHPTTAVLSEWYEIESNDLTDEDGAAPRPDRTDRTFLFDGAFEADDATPRFEVVREFKNDWDDSRVVIDAPAPWDVPEDFEGDDPNDVVTAAEWDDIHYDLDTDAGEWTIDAHGLDALRERATAEGYEWADTREDGDEDEDLTDDEARIRDLVEFVTEGDTVTVRYQKANGNGRNTYEGEVTSHTVQYTDRNEGLRMGTGRTWGLVFEDTGGKTKRVKCDDDGTAALFSNGHYPFMGEVESVEVEVSTPEWA